MIHGGKQIIGFIILREGVAEKTKFLNRNDFIRYKFDNLYIYSC